MRRDPLGADNDDVAAELRRLATSGLLALYMNLEPPPINELDGEYTATLLAQPNLFAVVPGKVAVANPLGPWLCKGCLAELIDAVSSPQVAARAWRSLRAPRSVCPRANQASPPVRFGSDPGRAGLPSHEPG